MQIKRFLKKTPFWIFSISFAFYFTFSLIYPEQTNNWVANQGMHILVLEIYGLFTFVMLISIAGLKLSGRKLYSWITILFWILLIIFFYAVYDYSKNYTLWLLVFFVMANVIKFINFIRSEENYAGAWRGFYVTFIALIASAFIAVFPASFFFRANQTLAYSLMGICYFILLIIVDLISDYYGTKSNEKKTQG